MKLKLDNIIYTTDDPVKIETLKSKGAEEIKAASPAKEDKADEKQEDKPERKPRAQK